MRMSAHGSRNPLVSVLVPAYNAQRTIGLALLSMQRQSLGELEIVVVDDGSTDETATIVTAMAARDPRILLVSQRNTGIVGALNTGLQHCRARFVARMDADDYSLPWRLARQVALLEASPEVGVCGCAILPLHEPWLRPGLPQRMPTHVAGIRTRLLFNPPVMHPTVVFRRALVDVAEFYPAGHPHAEDYALWSRLAHRTTLTNDRRLGLLYRRTAQAVSNRHVRVQRETAARIRRTNLAHLLGEEFAAANAAPHEELIAREGTDTAGVTAYVERLAAAPGIDPAVVADHWFGYCLARARAGDRDAARRYAVPRGLANFVRRVALEAICRTVHA